MLQRTKWMSMTALLALLWLVACQPRQEPAVTVPPAETESAGAETAEPTPQASDTPMPTATAAPTDTPIPSPTSPPPTATATTSPAAATRPTPAPESDAPLQVVYVEPDDVLNVREGAGVDAEIRGALPPGSSARVEEWEGQMANDHLWLPISDGETSGWVNSLFLTEQISSQEFCQADEPLDLVTSLQEAVAAREGDELMPLLSTQRGLRVRTSWWNPEVRLAGDGLQNLFSQSQGFDWGHEDGSGRPIEGSFQDVILPLLEQDLLGATDIACNEILHGNTAGLVQLPPEYEGINFYSVHRAPAPDDIGFDWGTWVVGIERWQGEYHIAFLVHYAYEI
ncbi:MAG TPA: SH3 domain-containing protein [Candidatus Sulfomarinibacteraceae bacterium]|nr:SH3 domain-containing protein [Candidatus Sulfomarinibacteraceae bacterium]